MDSDVADLSNGLTSPPSAQPFGQKPLHAPPLSGTWAHAPSSVNLTAHPIRFYVSSPVQPSHPFGHLPPHVPVHRRRTATFKTVKFVQQSGIEASESTAPSGYGQPYVRGLGINQTYRRVVFEVITSLAQTDLLMYSKNPIILLPNVPSNYITNSVAFSAQSLTHDNGKPILICEHCKKQRHTKDQCWKLQVGPQEVTNAPPMSNRTQGYQCMSQSLGLISVDGTNPWILDLGATDHLTGFSEYFVSYTPCAGNEKIRIANGSLAPIAGKGQIVLFDGFSLQNVLHVPKLSYHLLSISKITPELHCKATFLPESVCFQDLNSGRTIGTVGHSRGLYILNDDTSGSSISTTSYYLPILTSLNMTLCCSIFVAHLINRMPSRILHLQTPLECLKESYPLLVSFQRYPPHQRGYKCFHPPSRKYFVTMDVTFCEDRPYFPVSHLQGERGIRKEVGSPTSQPPAPIQDSKAPRDQGMENPTEPCTINTMNENDRSDVAVLENVEEKNSGDETEVRIKTSNNEAEQGHTGKLDKYGHSLDLPIALRKGCSELKNAVMEEMKALEKNNTWEVCALPKGHKPVGCKWVFILKYKLDVKNAFLNGDLVDESPRAWFDRFITFVKSQGYSQGHSDHILFTKVSGKIAVLIVYVDDIVLSGDDQTESSQLKQRMDLKKASPCLLTETGMLGSQRKYTLDLLTETGMLGCRLADTPIEFNCKLGNFDDQVPVDKEQYPRLVGKLIYLSHTHPDISFTTDKKTIEEYTDSDSAGSVVDRKSTSGYCTFVWGNLVTWRSKKQSVVARSSVEAEYRAMSLGICEEIWLQKVLSNLHQECETPLKLFCDNKAAINIANNPVQHDRTKHIEIDRHFIKERLDSGSIRIPYIPSSQQVADVLTKGLLRPNFDFCVSKLGLIDIYVST
ncbi:Cysteine-rich RLK (RECEPTOR-like protein kinase) 8 [Cucumis melo var. makuwa]|uniref:Cysteine-rich RLK (RECEPTOR-like protein kinase) 8 n=1 Tax=Cucumis melo var. makuwa TaxID=1194695 RepID=A0A5A7UPS0_CUCMM|nr:Cysteine-rich RLK (RECEPTOR-like protein kinase) 8 [Cucumis melo var. makuwa]